ncbi:chorismate mutase [Effusibacillus dendaii]|uniref:chorismate mutase n=1 Tax=Effusibacillus dendaii TaxID=2743772 RepID=A0A7I8D5I2_9BACL|nr:chorismate mutase [Effusibacillus dendaii]BCJ85398.1 chorismate mutase AroH [Effusibacillus dendaii]
MIRGIRGANTVEENSADVILKATGDLMKEIIAANDFQPEEVASVLVTVTHDLDAAFPAAAIRTIPGWNLVPVMCAQEIPVPGSMPMCIRVMLHVNTDLPQKEINHIFLGRATALRPDLAEKTKS